MAENENAIGEIFLMKIRHETICTSKADKSNLWEVNQQHGQNQQLLKSSKQFWRRAMLWNFIIKKDLLPDPNLIDKRQRKWKINPRHIWRRPVLKIIYFKSLCLKGRSSWYNLDTWKVLVYNKSFSCETDVGDGTSIPPKDIAIQKSC